MSAEPASEMRVQPAAALGVAGMPSVAVGGRAALEKNLRTARTPGQLALARLRRARMAMVGLFVLLLFVLIAVFAPVIAPADPRTTDLFNIKAPPSGANWLGTDELGRDVVTRLIYGTRISLSVGVGAAVLATVLGVVVGAVAGFYGRWVDGVLMRFVDVMLAFPSIFLLLIIFTFDEVGRSATTVVIFLGFFGWMWLARIVRGEFLALKQREFVEAAHALGAPDGRIIRRHLLPNVIAPIVVSVTLGVAYGMIAESTLSFLGFGVDPATPTWGNMLNAARSSYLTDPHLAIAPGLALTLAVLAVNFVGDGLRDAFDPRTR